MTRTGNPLSLLVASADLPLTPRVSTTVTGIKNFIAEVIPILIAAGKNHRVCTLSSAPGNTGDARPVHSRTRQGFTRIKTTSLWISRNVTKDLFYHKGCPCEESQIMIHEGR